MILALSLVLAVRFSETITLGSILLGLVIGSAGLVTFGYGARWKAAYEVAEATVKSLEEGRTAYQKRADRLQDEREVILREFGDCKAKLAEALARPTQETVVEMLERMDAHATERTMKAVEAVQRAMVDHERHAQERYEAATERAQERHEMQMAVMAELARGLKHQNDKT